ncbi:MAG: tetratricopeptide repeat protein [Rhodanobacter sp.]
MAFIFFVATAPAVGRSEDVTHCIEGLDASNGDQYAKAIGLFNFCIENGNLSQESLVSTYRNIGIAYRMTQQPAKTVAAANSAIALHPLDVANDYVNRGNAYDDEGKSAKALTDYKHALELSPNNVQALYNRGVSYEHQKEFAKAQSDFIAAFNHGLRSTLLHERLVMYRLIKPGNPGEWTPLPPDSSEQDER